MGTLVGLVCAQTCKNSWSSIGYANLAATFPTAAGEPDWDTIRQRRVDDIVPCIWHGPYFYRKATRIHAILSRAFEDSGGVSTSLEHLHSWPSAKVRAPSLQVVVVATPSTLRVVASRAPRRNCTHSIPFATG
jgi:hypothetical protein